MRINLLIDKNGNYMNPRPPLIWSSPITGESGSTLYSCQASLEFFNSIIKESNGLYVPDETTVVTNGLSGMLTFNLFPSKFSPYPVSVTSGNVIDISDTCTFQWTGVVDHINFIATSIVNCNYINVLLDRI